MKRKRRTPPARTPEQRERAYRRKLAHRARMLEEGRCTNCGQPRGPDATADRCRYCADVFAAYQRRWRARKRKSAA